MASVSLCPNIMGQLTVLNPLIVFSFIGKAFSMVNSDGIACSTASEWGAIVCFVSKGKNGHFGVSQTVR
jgi:hypothetical protein